MKINEQIRALRRERKMTQEQLAEAVGVSAAAVSKWESGLSVPEISMMIALADYFEVSLDMLVGYEVRSRRKTDMAEDIRRMTAAKQYEEAQHVAEEALRRYPNDFAVVFRCAELYATRGMEQDQSRDLRQALMLFDRAQGLFEQNADPELRREIILHYKGVCCACLGWHEQALRWFEQSNVMGVNDQHIASCLVELKQYDKALPKVSGKMYKGVAAHFNSVIDASICLMAIGRAGDAEELLAWGLDVIRNLEVTRGSYVLKMRAILCTLASQAAVMQGKAEAARDFLARALRWAGRYDEQPDPTVGSVKFCYLAPQESFCDNVGETALRGVERMLRNLRDVHGMPQAAQIYLEEMRKQTI